MFRALSFAAALFAATTVQAQAEAQNSHGTHSEHGSAHGHHHADFASDRIHVRIDGDMDGRDIILIPGLSSSSEIWQGLDQKDLGPPRAAPGSGSSVRHISRAPPRGGDSALGSSLFTRRY